MAAQQFIGRTRELQQLQIQHNKTTASLVVVKGRRRIGKSRLIAEFSAQFPQKGRGTVPYLIFGCGDTGLIDGSERYYFGSQFLCCCW